MADAKATKKKAARKQGPRYAVKLANAAGVGLKVGTSFDYRNGLFRVQSSIWPKGFGKGYPSERIEPKTIGKDFAEAEAAAKEQVAEAEGKGWVRLAAKGTAKYSEIPGADEVEVQE